MKRKAILIGNTSGLGGVKVDLNQFSRFLLSDTGGAWIGTEIEILTDIRINDLTSKLSRCKSEENDYVIILFSGHGGQIRNETVIELNKYGEKIGESNLWGVGQRQLTIFDCCRCYDRPILEDSAMNRFESVSKSLSNVRTRYENRILQAIPQQARLYSCAVGEVSYDTPEGGVYLSNLISAAKSVGEEYKLVGLAHQETEIPTLKHSLTENDGVQNPKSILPKCFSNQQLIISIRP